MKHVRHMAWLCLVLFLPCFLRAQTAEQEPNETIATANLTTLAQKRSGQVATLTDKDYFAFGILPAGAYILTVRYPQGAGPNGVKNWFLLLNGAIQNEPEIPGYCYYPDPLTHLYVFVLCQPTNVVLKMHANTDFGLINKPYEIGIEKDSVDVNECNNTLTSARTLTQSGVYQGRLATRQDEKDMFGFKAPAAGTLKLRIAYPNANTPKLLAALGRITNQQPLIVQAPAENTVVEITEAIAQAGDYYITIQHALDTVTFTPYSLTVDFKPACTLDVNAAAIKTDSAACPQNNGRITLPAPTGGLAPFRYALNGGTAQNSPIFENLAAGTYKIVTTDSLGCADTVSVVVACKPCAKPQVGISVTQEGAMSKADFAVTTNGTVVSIDYGDGNKGTAAISTHIYAKSGLYTVTVTAQNACGTSTATVTVNVIISKFVLGSSKNVKPNTEVKIPFYVAEGQGVLVTLTGTLPDSSKFEFKGFWSGTIPVQSPPPITNPTEGRFIINLNSGINYKTGDTLLYFLIKTKPNLPPGDSIRFDIRGGKTPFEVYTMIGNTPAQIEASLVPAKVEIVRRVKIGIDAKGVKGNAAKGEAIIRADGKEYRGVTDANGMITFEIDYTDSIFVQMRRDTIVQDGINIIDIIIANRSYVGLATTGETIYSYLAAARFNGDNKLNPLDIIGMQNLLVGNISFPQVQQFMFIPASHKMPQPTDPTYFQFPTRILILKPDPSQVAKGSFVVVQAGDVDHSNLRLDRSPASWRYTQQTTGNVTTIYLYADRSEGAFLDLRFDSHYELMDKEVLQGNTQAAFNNEKSRLRASLINQDGFDTETPVMVLRFKNNGAGAAPVLLPASRGESGDSDGNVHTLRFEDKNTTSGVQVYPTLARDVVQVTMPATPHTIELFSGDGKLQFSTQNDGGDTSIPVAGYPAGIYLLKVTGSGSSSVHRVMVVK